MSEELISDITRDMLTDLLKKFPRKKPAYKEYCHENGIIEMDELPEAMALEILETLDSASYIRANRAKEEARLKANYEHMIFMLDDYLTSKQDIYMVLDKVPNCYLVCKKITVRVQHKNENNVFQPYETITPNEYFICVLIKLAEDYQPTELIKNFLIRGCKMVKISSVDSVARILDAVT